jgi:hypothetical protein
MRNLFIITDEGIHIGRANFHKKLADKLEIPHNHIIYGGGVFDQRTKSNDEVWILFGQSSDFGKFDEEMIQYFLDRNKVFWMGRPIRRQMPNVTFEVDDDRIERTSDEF